MRELCIICGLPRDGAHMSYCKKCNAERVKQYYQNNKKARAARAEYHRQYYLANRESLIEKQKKYYQDNKEARTEQKKQYYLDNKESIREYHRQYYMDNKQRSAEYRQKNKESIAKYKKQYRQDNPDDKRRSEARRRARKLQNGVEFYTEQQVLDLYGTDCHICNEPIDLAAPRSAGVGGWEKGLHVDHVIPISKGGPDTLDNVRPAHAQCNLKKSATI